MVVLVPKVTLSHQPYLKKLWRVHYRKSFHEVAIDVRMPFRHPGHPPAPWWRP
jgi:hypothetical protein